MGFDKDEVVPATKAKKKGNGSASLGDVTWGHLRFQDYTKGGHDHIHIHDDPKNLVFVWDEAGLQCTAVENFRQNVKEFLKDRHHFRGSFVVFRGKNADPGSGRKAADWVWSFDEASSKWQMRLEPAGAQADIVFANDPAGDFMSDWISRIG